MERGLRTKMNPIDDYCNCDISCPPVPPVKPLKNCGSCDTCIKEDVCVYKDSYLSAKSDIELIEGRTNVFMDNIIRCDKWVSKISLR